MVPVLVVLIITGVVLILVLLALVCAYGCRGKSSRRRPFASVLANPSVETLQLPESVVRPPPFNPSYAPTPVLGRAFEPSADSGRALSSSVTTASSALLTSNATASSAVQSHAPSAPPDSFPPLGKLGPGAPLDWSHFLIPHLPCTSDKSESSWLEAMGSGAAIGVS
nr:unnamed protein product [Spirometra erinaceieuropaei]